MESVKETVQGHPAENDNYVKMVTNTKRPAHHCGVAPVLRVVGTLCYEDVTLQNHSQICQRSITINFKQKAMIVF